MNKLFETLDSYLDGSQIDADWESHVPIDVIINDIKFFFTNFIDFKNLPNPKSFIVPSEIAVYWETDELYIELGFDNKSEYTYLVIEKNINSEDVAFGEDDVTFESGLTKKLKTYMDKL